MHRTPSRKNNKNGHTHRPKVKAKCLKTTVRSKNSPWVANPVRQRHQNQSIMASSPSSSPSLSSLSSPSRSATSTPQEFTNNDPDAQVVNMDILTTCVDSNQHGVEEFSLGENDAIFQQRNQPSSRHKFSFSPTTMSSSMANPIYNRYKYQQMDSNIHNKEAVNSVYQSITNYNTRSQSTLSKTNNDFVHYTPKANFASKRGTDDINYKADSVNKDPPESHSSSSFDQFLANSSDLTQMKTMYQNVPVSKLTNKVILSKATPSGSSTMNKNQQKDREVVSNHTRKMSQNKHPRHDHQIFHYNTISEVQPTQNMVMSMLNHPLAPNGEIYKAPTQVAGLNHSSLEQLLSTQSQSMQDPSHSPRSFHNNLAHTEHNWWQTPLSTTETTTTLRLLNNNQHSSRVTSSDKYRDFHQDPLTMQRRKFSTSSLPHSMSSDILSGDSSQRNRYTKRNTHPNRQQGDSSEGNGNIFINNQDIDLNTQHQLKSLHRNLVKSTKIQQKLAQKAEIELAQTINAYQSVRAEARQSNRSSQPHRGKGALM